MAWRAIVSRDMTQPWYEADEKYLPAHYQPALLMDLLLARDISSHRFLRATGLFYDDVLAGKQLLSLQQLSQLIQNGDKLVADGDLSFRWGANLWPGHYGVASQLLSQAPDLRRALKVLVSYRRILCPLLAPRVYEDERYCYVQWLDAAGMQSEHRFMVEASMTGLSAMTAWLSGRTLPWHYGFHYRRPHSDEHYQVNLPGSHFFELGTDVMIIDRAWLDRPWPRASVTAFQAAWQASVVSDELLKPAFCERVYELIRNTADHEMSLTLVADTLAMSPATFKRKLKKHHRTFQQIQDQVKLDISLYLLHMRGYNNEQVARHLQFNDTTNFRRAFKRWTGLTPSDVRMQFRLADI